MKLLVFLVLLGASALMVSSQDVAVDATISADSAVGIIDPTEIQEVVSAAAEIEVPTPGPVVPLPVTLANKLPPLLSKIETAIKQFLG